MLDENDWNAIYRYVESRVQPTEIVFDTVIRRDTKHRVVWTPTFGDTPIPLIGFTYNVPIFDLSVDGRIIDPDMDVNTDVEEVIAGANVIVPPVGSVICIVRQFGKNRTPMCVGQSLSVTNYDPPDVPIV